MLFRLLILVIQSKKTDCNTKINQIEKKITDHDHNKYITTKEFNKLTSENCDARLARANLESKNDTADFVKKKPTDFDHKLKNLNKKVTSNKTKHLQAEKKIFKPFHTQLEPTLSNLANGRVILKLNNTVLVENSFSSLCSNFILNLYIVYELNNQPRNPTNNFTLENYLFGTV